MFGRGNKEYNLAVEMQRDALDPRDMREVLLEIVFLCGKTIRKNHRHGDAHMLMASSLHVLSEICINDQSSWLFGAIAFAMRHRWLRLGRFATKFTETTRSEQKKILLAHGTNPYHMASVAMVNSEQYCAGLFNLATDHAPDTIALLQQAAFEPDQELEKLLMSIQITMATGINLSTLDDALYLEAKGVFPPQTGPKGRDLILVLSDLRKGGVPIDVLRGAVLEGIQNGPFF